MSCLPEPYLPLNKVRRGLAWRRLSYCLLVFAVIVLTSWDLCVLWEVMFRPGAWWRLLVFWGGAVAFPIGVLTGSARKVFHECHLRSAARLLQQENPQLGQRLECALDIIPLAGTSEFITAALKQTGKDLSGVDCSAAMEKVLNKRRMFLAFFLLLLAAAGAAFSPGVYSNALHRLMLPFRDTLALGSVVIAQVSPGNVNCLYGDEITISVKLQNHKSAELPVLIVDSVNQPPQERKLRPAADGSFNYTLRNLQNSLRYRIACANSASAWYTLKVTPPPSVKSAVLVVLPPAYTGMRKFYVPLEKGVVSVPDGSQINFIAEPDRPVKSSFLSLPGGGLCPLNYADGKITGSFSAVRNGTCNLTLQEEGGRAVSDAAAFALELQADAQAVVRMLQPQENLQCAPGSEIGLKAQARDDYGVRELFLYFKRNQNGQPQRLPGEMVLDKNGRQATIEHRFLFEPSLYLPGDQITIWAHASDNAPGENRLSQSRKITITLIDSRKQQQQQVRGLNQLLAMLSKTLQQQKQLHRDTVSAAKLSGEQYASECRRLEKSQKDVGIQLRGSADAIGSLSDPFSRRASQVLRSMSGAEVVMAAHSLAEAAEAGDKGDAQRGVLAKALKPQAQIIFRLQQILGIAGDALEQAKNPLGKDGEDMSNPLLEKMQKAKDELDKFVESQRKVAEAAEDLAKKDVDDFTNEDKQKLEELKATEENWANFLRELQSDLSKIPPQDFSNPSMLGEVAAVLEEVEMVADSLTAKEINISTTAAEAGVELAESLQHHLEKWLMDKADHTAWKMEEPLEDYEIPMAELPEKLEDIIGELVEQEEELMDEAEDQSSSWADSLDEGAGWDAADGPMSNFSAQGVTGNQLPNSSEVGGRSGEGRQGKSHGEMVGDTAVGKGGRRTPSRLTPDAFEEGQINDQSEESSGGATGGGKGGNAGAEGLEGPAPASQEKNLPRMLGKQAELRNRAERIRLQLKLRGHNTTLIDKTLGELRTAESELKSGRYAEGGRITRQAVQNLRQYGENLADNSRLQADHAAALPKELEREMLQGVGDGLPSGYEDMVRGYYDRLASDVSE